MIETIAALFLAHILADFLFQSNSIAHGKQTRSPWPMAAHIAIVYVTAAACVGVPFDLYLAALAGAHLIIDVTKSFLPKARLWPFLLDQAAHLATLGVIGMAAPGLWAMGAWAGLDWLPSVMVLLAGLIAATRAGGFAVGILLGRFADPETEPSLPKGGRVIGLLERGLLYLLVMVGQPAGIGILIAAKSIQRFEALTSKDANAAREYILIGTLASFGWAMVVSWGVLALLGALHPIGIPALSP